MVQVPSGGRTNQSLSIVPGARRHRQGVIRTEQVVKAGETVRQVQEFVQPCKPASRLDARKPTSSRAVRVCAADGACAAGDQCGRKTESPGSYGHEQPATVFATVGVGLYFGRIRCRVRTGFHPHGSGAAFFSAPPTKEALQRGLQPLSATLPDTKLRRGVKPPDVSLKCLMPRPCRFLSIAARIGFPSITAGQPRTCGIGRSISRT